MTETIRASSSNNAPDLALAAFSAGTTAASPGCMEWS